MVFKSRISFLIVRKLFAIRRRVFFFVAFCFFTIRWLRCPTCGLFQKPPFGFSVFSIDRQPKEDSFGSASAKTNDLKQLRVVKKSIVQNFTKIDIFLFSKKYALIALGSRIDKIPKSMNKVYVSVTHRLFWTRSCVYS